MRLHHLTVSAFGPFADTVEIDFDELNDAGVFLVTGPTGAGKTSILDAVCFALYGVVPGVRDIKSLRSHHAAPDARPEVVLEATVAGRRLRIVRSPEWHRPKKRGEGTTREHAQARLIELVDGGERLLSSRAQEVGHELGLALGMSSEQFMQVVMLPQGEFQRFLRASSDQRQDVLQRLFRSQRFEQIEEWVRDHTRALASAADRDEKQVAQLLATLSHRAATPLPDELAEDRLGDVATAARTWAGSVVSAAEQAHVDALSCEEQAQVAVAAAETAAAEATRVAAAAARRAAALEQLSRWAATAEEATEQARLLHRHGQALVVRPHLDPLTALQGAHQHALEQVATATAEARRLWKRTLADGDVDEPQTSWRLIRDTLVERLALLRAALPRERAAVEAARDLTRARAGLISLEERCAALAVRCAEVPAELAALEERLSALRARAAQLPAAVVAEQRAADRDHAALALPAAAAAHAELVERGRDARDRAADARAHHLDLLERRLAGIAAELAGQLADGEPCQVCGSTAHPEPARATAAVVTDEDQAAAEAVYERLRKVAETLVGDVEASTRRLVELERCADGTVEAAAEALAAARATLASARRAATAVPLAEQERAVLKEEELVLSKQRQDAERTRGLLTGEAAAATERLTEARTELAAVVGGQLREHVDDPDAPLAGDEPGHRPGSLARLVEEHGGALAAVEQLVDRLEEGDRLAVRLADVTAQAERVAGEQGFASAAEATAALLPAMEVTALRTAAEERAQLGRNAEAVLADEEVRRLAPPSLAATGAGAAGPPAVPDLEHARAEVDAARRQLRECTATTAETSSTVTALRRLAADLDEALAAWEPVRERHLTAAGISRLVRGMSADNQLQMRLSSYVLATRLDQVLDAANGRLCEMRDQRYTLRRTGRARGGSRAGLGIELLDAWTGEARTPATLSGGETFVVSLALALGLADVVGQEAGGLRVDTLFVDEGFGMLDPDTLDDVMDRIDALRAGGRTVGVVSHVSELRTRIPTQLHVDRGRNGSSVAVRTLIA